MTKKTVSDFQVMKRAGAPVAWITAYSYPFAQAAENASVDMILVGDSGGMVELGYDSTKPVTMAEMVTFCKAVRRGAPDTFVVGDMPFGSYEVGDDIAVSNAIRLCKESGCDAVKLEGGRRVCNRVKAIVDAGLIVVGHLGLTPQTAAAFGGYKVQGKTLESFERIVEDANALQAAGAGLLLLEAIPASPASQIADLLKIPVYGIGAGSMVDGQLVIMHDLVGFYQSFRPRFAKCYIPHVVGDFCSTMSSVRDLRKHGRRTRSDGLMSLVTSAVSQYVSEVKDKAFPCASYSYSLSDAELTILNRSKYWQ